MTEMAYLSKLKRSGILQIMLCDSFLVYFIFWDWRIRTVCGKPSILIKQRVGIVNFRVSMDVPKAVKLRRVMLLHTISHSEVNCIGGRELGQRAQSNRHGTTADFKLLSNEIEPQPFVRLMRGRALITGQTQSIKFFVFFQIKHKCARPEQTRAPGAGGVVFRVWPFQRVISLMVHH